MERLTLTSFGTRPTSIAEIQAVETIRTATTPHEKWAILRDLNVARAAFDVSDRDLGVLNALLSFHPTAELAPDGQLIVFPSNRRLAERAHGMAESTLRRHLAALVRAGLIHRHDSPNGKRYVRRGQGGEIAIAFGFDLAPLLERASEIAYAAAEARAATARFQLLRERVSLRLRDVSKLLELALDEGKAGNVEIETLAAVRRTMRRKAQFDELKAVEGTLASLLVRLTAMLEVQNTEDLNANDTQNERHQQSSNTYSFDSEPSLEEAEEARPVPLVPLTLVLKSCPEIALYASGEVLSWRDLQTASAFVRGMLGISESAWQDACDVMGGAVAAIVVACILQRFEAIRSPGGYLRALTEKAEQGVFSPGPMVMALLSNHPEKVAS